MLYMRNSNNKFINMLFEAIIDLKDYTSLKTQNVYANKTNSNFKKGEN